ncbi:molybdopterin-binding protein [Streptomyces sp. NPDC006552]|uniref:molybdopterin molybdotransferase MoeA n=1 Tax=Streptomyces sp. NPDC006552 TaxID=3157179 RepID=UPI0033B62269
MSDHEGRAAQARPVAGSDGADSLDSDLDEALALANDNRGGRDSRGGRDGRGTGDSRDSRDNRDQRDDRDNRDDRDDRDDRDHRDSHDGRDEQGSRAGRGSWSDPRAASDRGTRTSASAGPTSTPATATAPPPRSAAPPAATEHPPATAWPAARRLAHEAGLRAARHRADAAEARTGVRHAEPAGRTERPLADALLADFAEPTALPRGAVRVPLDQALGLVLAVPLTALTDLPSFDTSAMDGWAVAGPGPWSVRDEGILAGHARLASLADGEAATIATGARIPADTTAVIRSEHGRMDDKGQLHPMRRVAHGQDIRPRGQECRSGDLLLPAGGLVTPAVLGLAAAAGYDELVVHPRPRAEVLVLGDELLASGLPREGLIRDALGPMLPHWLRALGVEVTAVRRIGDDAKALLRAVRGAKTDLVVTTGGTASGPVDHVHPTLRALDAELLVDGVAVRPGHPMLLARIKPGQYLVGLPGNPLAAVSGLLTLAEPLLRALAGRVRDEAPYGAPLHSSVQGHPHDTRLVPVVLRQDGDSGHDWAVPLHYNGPAMLRGVAAADGLAVVPPGGAQEGHEVEIIDLPWSWGAATGDALGVPATPFRTTATTPGTPTTPGIPTTPGTPKAPTQQNAQSPAPQDAQATPDPKTSPDPAPGATEPTPAAPEPTPAAATQPPDAPAPQDTSQNPPQDPPHVGEQTPHDTMGHATLTTARAGTQAAGNSAGDEGCFT